MKFRMLVTVLSVLALALRVSVAAENTDLVRLVAAVESSQSRLLRHPGGLKITYTLSHSNAPGHRSYFAFKYGLQGELVLKYPRMRSKVSGDMSGIRTFVNGKPVDISEPTVRAASFDFDTWAGAAHDNDDLGQITNFRSPFSSSSVYPLRFQSFQHFDQHFSPTSYSSDYWLPAAFKQGAYLVDGAEEVNGYKCLRLRREGLDVIWVATEMGGVIAKREYNYGVNRSLRERSTNTKIKEISPGVWFAHHTVHELFSETDDEVPAERFVVDSIVTDVGAVSDDALVLEFPPGIERIEDTLTGRVLEKSLDGVAQLDTALEQSLASLPFQQSPAGNNRRVYLLLSQVVAFLFLVIVWLIRRTRSAEKAPVP